MTETLLQPSEIEKSFFASIDEYCKIPANDVRLPNADPVAIVTQIRGLWPGLQKTRPELVRLYDFNASRFDRLLQFALGLAYADAVYNMRTRPSDEFLGKVAEAIELRSAMLSDLDALAKHKVLTLDPLSVPEITKGYENIISTLSKLSVFFSNNWSVVNGRCALRPEDLAHADSLASYIQTTIGTRAHGGKAIEDASDMRNRSFTLTIDTYNEIRAGVLYTHRHAGDADEIAPSLFVSQNKRKKTTEETMAEPAVVVPPAPPTAATSKPVPSGGPGGNPFLD